MSDFQIDATSDNDKIRLRMLVEAALEEYARGVGVMTQKDWLDASVEAVIKLKGAAPIDAWLEERDFIEAKLDNLDRFHQADLESARTEGTQAGIAAAIDTLSTFCDSEPTLGEEDKKDVPGVRRAVTILRRALA